MFVWLLTAGRVVSLPSQSDSLSSQQYIAVAELQAGRDGRNDRIALGAGLPAFAIDKYLSDEVVERTVVFWAPASKAVGAKRQRVLGSLVLAEQTVKVDDEKALPVLLKVCQGCQYGAVGCQYVMTWSEGRQADLALFGGHDCVHFRLSFYLKKGSWS